MPSTQTGVCKGQEVVNSTPPPEGAFFVCGGTVMELRGGGSLCKFFMEIVIQKGVEPYEGFRWYVCACAHCAGMCLKHVCMLVLAHTSTLLPWEGILAEVRSSAKSGGKAEKNRMETEHARLGRQARGALSRDQIPLLVEELHVHPQKADSDHWATPHSRGHRPH